MSAGSVLRDPERGTWTVVLSVTAGDGRRQLRRRGFKTKREAVEALDHLRAEARTGIAPTSARVTVGVYLAAWLAAQQRRLRPSTWAQYRSYVNAHVVPHLGGILLKDLGKADVAAWIEVLVREPVRSHRQPISSPKTLAPKTVRIIHSLLVKALNDAVDDEIIVRNVALRPSGLPGAERSTVRAWTPAQVSQFLTAVAGDRLAPLWRLIAVTGMRRGEAVGLRWRDVDLVEGVATICWQRTTVGGRVHEGPPKTTAGNRTVALDDSTVAIMKAWKRQQSAERLVMGAGWPAHDLVFTNADGGAVWPNRPTAEFAKHAAALGFPPIGVHGLRHSAATMMMAAGVNPKVVQQRLGHAHVSITLNLYTHVMPGHDRAAVDGLAKALDAGS